MKKRKIKETALILLNEEKCAANPLAERSRFWLPILKEKKRNIDVLNIKNYIAKFKECIEKIRAKVLSNSSQPSSLCTTVSNKRPRHEDSKRQTSLEVCDIVLSEIQHRFSFSFSEHLVIAQLFYAERFIDYRKKFPEDTLKLVKVNYPLINYFKVKTELEVMSDREDFDKNSGVISILQLFINNNLCDTFSECVKLLTVLCTLPMTTVESERCFSTLKRIKTFLRKNTMGEDRLCALAMLLTMEKSLFERSQISTSK
uniref:Uncharacterized protein LOC114325145 n=1 Tax=Diabrotica virgifera virgifera TaxID=50390 RepID=A0A6P7F220_DIAVI